MRSFIYLLVIGAAAYVGYTFYKDKVEGKADEGSAPSATATSERSSEPGGAPERVVRPFKSKIVIPDGPPGQKHVAKPGVFYVLERTSIQHATGVAAVVPGEEVHLMKRNSDGTVKVTSGKYEFELKESQLTNDLDVAQEAERKFVATHPPSR